MSKLERIGILGGTFNPVHTGHILLAEGALKRVVLNKVLLVPAYIAPHKLSSEPKPLHHHIVNMLKLAIDGRKNIAIDDVEIKRCRVSYTIDTLKELANKHSEAELYLIIGADQFREFHLWKSYREIFRFAVVVVASRDGLNVDVNGKKIIEKFAPRLIFMDDVNLPVSSSIIRKLVRQSNPFANLVHPKVGEYIRRHRLYLMEEKRNADSQSAK